MAHSSGILPSTHMENSIMANYFTILFGILSFIHSVFGGLLHGVGYSADTTPFNYNYGRIASPYSSQITAHPVAATYSTRYTAYTAVPLTTSLGAPAFVPRQAGGGLIRAFAAPSLSRHSGYSNRLIRQGVSAYAAIPIAGYRASFGGPSIRSYGASVRGFPLDVSVQGLYPSVAGFDDYTDPLLNDQRAFGNFDNENPLPVW